MTAYSGVDIDAIHAQLLACPGSTAVDLAFSLVAEAKRLRAQVDDYRMMIDEHQMDNQHAYEEGGHAALVEEVERLRAERDHFREAWAAAQVRLDCGVDATEAVREDRDAVVSMLRDCDERCREWDGRENAVSGTYRRAATMIERGEHRKEEP